MHKILIHNLPFCEQYIISCMQFLEIQVTYKSIPYLRQHCEITQCQCWSMNNGRMFPQLCSSGTVADMTTVVREGASNLIIQGNLVQVHQGSLQREKPGQEKSLYFHNVPVVYNANMNIMQAKLCSMTLSWMMLTANTNLKSIYLSI